MELVRHPNLLAEPFAPFNAMGKALRTFAMPLALWGMAILLPAYVAFPDSLSGLKIHGPYLTLATGLWLSLALRQGRAFLVLCSLTFAYMGFVFCLEPGTAPLNEQALYPAICIFAPLNIAVYTVLRERGIMNLAGLRRMTLPLIQIGLGAALVLWQANEVAEALYRPFYEHPVLARVDLPQAGIACTIAAVVVGVVCAVVRGSVLDAAFAAVVASFALACSNAASPGFYSWFCTMAGAIVAIAVVQDSCRMAFYDELTGLPGRRALNERMEALDGHFTVAMIDIDHFKVFNDTWGHDVGDQVLKLVAARLQRVGGGGKAYRYGGEEFTVVFPGQRAISLRYRLEALRKEIQTYQLMLRESDPGTISHRGAKPAPDVTACKWISVTVSIGVAERVNRFQPPGQTLKAADKALYQAKAEGRNRIVGPR